MSTPIVRLFGVVVVLFALLVFFTSRWTVFEASSLNNNPLNVRTLLDELQIKRGLILADDGTVLARSVPAPQHTWTRFYPTRGLFSQAVGYSIAAQGRQAGLEQSAGPDLRGVQTGLSSIFGQLSPRPVGDDVHTTLDPKAQRVAAQQLGRTGRLGGRARSEDGRGAGDVRQSDLRRQQPRPEGVHGAVVPGQQLDPGRVAARLDVQGGHRDGRDRQRRVHAQLGGQRRLAQDDLGRPAPERQQPELREHRPHDRADLLGQHGVGAGGRARRAQRR